MIRIVQPLFPRLTLLCAIALACLLLFTPGGSVPSGPSGADKVVHLFLFAMLAVSSRFAGIGEKPTLAWTLVFAGCSEVIQALWVPRRDGNALDLFTDTVGVLMGLLLWRKLRSARPERRASE